MTGELLGVTRTVTETGRERGEGGRGGALLGPLLGNTGGEGGRELCRGVLKVCTCMEEQHGWSVVRQRQRWHSWALAELGGWLVGWFCRGHGSK